jgi:hypothetical protein
MTRQKILTASKRAEFEKLVRITRNIDEKDHLRVVLAYEEGHDVCDIADILKSAIQLYTIISTII